MGNVWLMSGSDNEEAPRERLAKAMDARRTQLRITWGEVAQRANMSPQNLLRIRQDKISISWDAADGIDDALHWERGSVQAIQEGRGPVDMPVDVDPHVPGSPAELEVTMSSPADDPIWWADLSDKVTPEQLQVLLDLYRFKKSAQRRSAERDHPRGGWSAETPNNTGEVTSP